MTMKKLLCLALAIIMVVGVLAGCNKPVDPTTKPNVDNPTKPQGTTTPGGNDDPTVPTTKPIEITPFPEGDFIWKTSASSIATSWNPHTYQDTTQSVPLDYTTSGLYNFIFNDELHPVEGKAPFEGYVIVPEMAADMPVDVTAEVKAQYPQFAEIIPADINEGYAYKIVLNPDACWDDGTPINAETYVESFKRLLRPELLNYRATNWYGQTLSLAGAENYFNQGKSDYIDDASQSKANMVKGEDGNYYTENNEPVYIAVNYPIEWCSGYSLKDYVDAYGEGYFSLTYWQNLVDAMDENGLVALNDENYPWILDVMTGNPAWGESEDHVCNYLVYYKAYPETYDWENVGIIATGEYELLVVLDKSLAGFDLLYNISGLTSPLVKIDLYDSLLKSETGASGEEVWSSTYNTSVETTASYGPYKMSNYQLDKSMHFVRNEKWWGYHDGKHIYMDPEDGCVYQMYQTTEVDIQYVSESSVSKTMFMAGLLMGYGLQADDFDTLRGSKYCYATPGSTIFFLVLNGNMDAIQERENAEDFDKAAQDLEMLTNTAFHMAIGMSYNKDNFASTISPARSGALGIIGDGYIYDPDSGARYRDTDQAKQVLCDFYGVDVSKYASLDDAVKAITGYNPEQAKILFKQAFEEGIAAGYINDTNNDGKCDQMIRIEYSMGSDVNDFMTKTIKYLNDNLALALAGTPFEGKVEFYMSANYGSPGWSDKLKAGLSDVCLCGWSGSLLDPFGLTDLYTNPDYQYDAAWYDATKVDLTINVPVNGENKDVTLTLKQWSDALNGTAVEVDGVTYNYGSGQADIEVRLDILAACEGKILESYNYLPMLLDGSMALLSQQVYYVVEEYNPIMGRGGLAYTKYNFNEAEWTAYVAEQGGELDYA